MRYSSLAVSLALLGCNNVEAVNDPADGGASDSSTSTDATAMDATPIDGAADAFTGPTIHLVATAVESPSGAPIPDVTVCAYAEPGIPCVITDASGFFDLLLPANADTGVTLVVTGRDSVLVPFVTTTTNHTGARIGMSDVDSVTSFATALGAAYPPTTNGILFAYVSAPGGQSGLAGATSAIVPRSGSGPLYSTSVGTPDPQATATSVDGTTFYANVTPGEVTVTYAPTASSTTLSCQPSFGGWRSTQRNSVRVPIAAGFDTHVAVVCTPTSADAGAPADSGVADGAADAGGD